MSVATNKERAVKNTEEILHGNLIRAILALAIPVVINSFLQTMYNLTDTFWLGHIGSEQLAAINLVTPMQNIIINFGSGLTVAGSVLIAQYIGAKKYEDARSMASQIFVCAMILSLLCAAVCIIFTPALVVWMGASGNILDYSRIYLQTVMLDMPLLFTINIYTAVNQAQGDTVHPMMLNFLGIIINMILDPLFMMVLSMGTFGAALATLLAKLPPAIIALIALKKASKPVYLTFKNFRFEKAKLMNILKVGLPTAIGGSTMQVGFLLMSRNVYVYGKFAMAAYGIGNKVNGLISLPVNGIGSATATIVGQNVGANQIDRAQRGYVLSRTISIIFLLIGGMILSRPFISTSIVSIFTTDSEVVPMAAEFLSTMAFWCWTNAIYNTTTGLFQGTGYTNINMIVDATRLWVFRFLTIYVCEVWLHMGVRSIWYSVVVSNGISSLILYIVYKTGIWRKNRLKT